MGYINFYKHKLECAKLRYGGISTAIRIKCAQYVQRLIFQ